MNKNKILKIIYWTAAVLGVQTILFLGIAVMGYGFDNTDLSHFLVSIFSSVGVVIGLLIAYKWAFAGGLIGTLFYVSAFIIDRFNDDGYGCGLDSGSYDCDQTSIFAYFALPAVLFLIVGISKIVEAKKSKNKRLI